MRFTEWLSIREAMWDDTIPKEYDTVVGSKQGFGKGEDNKIEVQRTYDINKVINVMTTATDALSSKEPYFISNATRDIVQAVRYIDKNYDYIFSMAAELSTGVIKTLVTAIRNVVSALRNISAEKGEGEHWAADALDLLMKSKTYQLALSQYNAAPPSQYNAMPPRKL